MEDFANILHRDYGLKPGGKNAPMSGGGHSRAGSSGGAGMGPRSGSASRLPSDDVFSDVFKSSSVNGGGVRSNSTGDLYDDVFGGPPTGVRSSSNDAFGDLLGGFSGSGSRPPASQNTFTEDLLGGFGASQPRQSAVHASSGSLDDIFSGGLGPPRPSSHNSFMNHNDDPFGTYGVVKPEPKVTQSQTLFDDDWNLGSSKSKSATRGATLHASMDGDLLGGFSSTAVRSKQGTPFRSPQSSPPRVQHSEPVLDGFLPGFGGVKAGQRKVVREADAMRSIPIISTDDDDVFSSIPNSTSAATRDPLVDIPGAKSNGASDSSGEVPSVAPSDADEMRGIPPLSSFPILDDDPFSSGAELDPFANINADSVRPPGESSIPDPVDVFDLPPAASVPSGHRGVEGTSGPFSNGSGSYDGFPQAPPVSTAKPKEDPPPSGSRSGSEVRDGVSEGSGAWDEKPPLRRGFGGVPFTVDLNEVPEDPSPSYPSRATFEERPDRESNGFASKLDDEPKFDEPSVAGVDDRRGKPDTDKVPVDIFEERWLTVDEVKLVTMPSSSRPPSRAPPRPRSEKRRSSRSSVTPRDSVGERSRGRSDELPASRSSRSNGSDASQESDFSRERFAAREREAALVQKEREDADRERASRHRERAERQRERARERDRAREQEASRSVEVSRERADSRTDSSNGRDDESAERARRAAERAAKEAQQRMEKAAAERAIAEARERAEKSALARAAAARELAREKEQKEKEQKERQERDRREREERVRRERAREERERERSRREKEERERREREEREKERERDRERDRRRERERGSAEPPRATSVSSRATSEPRQRPSTSQAAAAPSAGVDVRRPSAANPVYSSTGSSSAPRKPQAPVKTVDDWTLLAQNAPTGDEFQDLPGETPERRKLRLERHQKTIERAQQALKEKNDRDKAQLMEQAERSRAADNLDAKIRRWATGKEGNLRALLSSLHLVLWPETNWKPLSLTDLIQGVSVRKAYQRAILCVHPDKVQQKGATVQQKYIAEKVFYLLKEAFEKFNLTELY